VCQVNNPVIFSGRAIGTVEFLNRMVETLGITIIDRHPKGRPCKMENYSIEK